LTWRRFIRRGCAAVYSPFSTTGASRRHPDVPNLKSPETSRCLATVQNLLRRPSTCSSRGTLFNSSVRGTVIMAGTNRILLYAGVPGRAPLVHRRSREKNPEGINPEESADLGPAFGEIDGIDGLYCARGEARSLNQRDRTKTWTFRGHGAPPVSPVGNPGMHGGASCPPVTDRTRTSRAGGGAGFPDTNPHGFPSVKSSATVLRPGRPRLGARGGPDDAAASRKRKG